MPSIFRRAINFFRALYYHILTGLATVSGRTYMKRLDVCNTCPYNKNGTCTQCGCTLIRKAKWKSSDCPIKKW